MCLRRSSEKRELPELILIVESPSVKCKSRLRGEDLLPQYSIACLCEFFTVSIRVRVYFCHSELLPSMLSLKIR